MPTRTHSNLCAQAGNTNLQCHEHFKFFSFPLIFLFAYQIWGHGGCWSLSLLSRDEMWGCILYSSPVYCRDNRALTPVANLE